MIFSPSIVAPNVINATSKDEHILAEKNSEKTKTKKTRRRQERINEATIQLLLKTKCAQFTAIGYQAFNSHCTTVGGVHGSLGRQKRTG